MEARVEIRYSRCIRHALNLKESPFCRAQKQGQKFPLSRVHVKCIDRNRGWVNKFSNENARAKSERWTEQCYSFDSTIARYMACMYERGCFLTSTCMYMTYTGRIREWLIVDKLYNDCSSNLFRSLSLFEMC